VLDGYSNFKEPSVPVLKSFQTHKTADSSFLENLESKNRRFCFFGTYRDQRNLSVLVISENLREPEDFTKEPTV
jgi:hypothetical protein